MFQVSLKHEFLYKGVRQIKRYTRYLLKCLCILNCLFAGEYSHSGSEDPMVQQMNIIKGYISKARIAHR